MIAELKVKEIKVRAAGKHLKAGLGRFTGSKTYSVVGRLGAEYIRYALGTDDKDVAEKRVKKVIRACTDGAESALWPELAESLPTRSFGAIAARVGYSYPNSEAITVLPKSKPRWADLTAAFESEMERRVKNKERGAAKEEGVMASGTRERYQGVICNFGIFLKERNINLLSELEASANGGLITLYKNGRMESILKLKQSAGGSSVALDVAILHAVFAYGVREKLMTRNPISLANHAKPGKNPRRPARPFAADELASLRKHAGKDTFSFLVLRWTGLRNSDAVNLKWQDVHFERGTNGEIEVMTQKRGKKAIIPLSSELRDALEAHQGTKSHFVLENPETKLPFTSRYRLYSRIKALGKRAGVGRVTPHCFRDTFICDMLARGVGIFDIASMVADTVETIETHYAQFVVAARNAAQHKMDSGVGIEEQAKLNQQRGRKVVGFPSGVSR